MEKTLPKIDISTDYIVGVTSEKHPASGIHTSVLNLYKNYPCRLKAEIFVLCMGGDIEATINLTPYTIRKNDLIILSPGSIIQFHKLAGDLKIYFMAFSSQFVNSVNLASSLLDFLFVVKAQPVVRLPDKIAVLYEDFYKLMIRIYDLNLSQNKEVYKCILLSILYRFKELYQYRNKVSGTTVTNRNEEICKEFGHLVTQYYLKERTIVFYAQKIGITPTHLSNTVKRTTGRTVMDIISEMVIADAKAQLKSTDAPIYEISESLNFPNVSFFGKYFKRYVGMSPQKYRNS